MVIKAFVIADNSRLKPIPSEDRSIEWLKDDVPRWIDIEFPEAEELSEFLAPLDIPRPILESCLKPSDESELERYESLIYIEFPIVTKNHELQRTYVSIIFLGTTLITIHMEPISGVSTLRTKLSIESIFHSSSISGLLYEIFVYFIKQTYHFYQDIRYQINNLSDSIHDNSDSVELRNILDIVRLVDFFISIIEDQNYCIESLLASESKTVGLEDQRQYFKDLSRSVQNGLRTLNRYDARVKDLHQYYMLTLQDRTNNRLKVLTIISAVILPLTLIAGIYGMNFEHMPELDNHYAYFIVLGIMFVIALALLFYFHRRGWFK